MVSVLCLHDVGVVIDYGWNDIFSKVRRDVAYPIRKIMLSCSPHSPWATELYSSSYPAMGTKLVVALYVTVVYVLVTNSLHPRVHPEEEIEPRSPSPDIYSSSSGVPEHEPETTPEPSSPANSANVVTEDSIPDGKVVAVINDDEEIEAEPEPGTSATLEESVHKN